MSVFRRDYGESFYFEKKAAYILYEEAFLWQPRQNLRCHVPYFAFRSTTLRPYGVTGTLLFT